MKSATRSAWNRLGWALLPIAALLFLARDFLASGWYAPKVVEWDWDFYWASREAVRRVWAAGGSLDPWIAHFCGGFPALDSTEIPLLSPFVLLWQALGAVPGTKWEFILVLAAGAVGMYRCARRVAPRGHPFIHAAAALHLVICGFLLMHMNAGHVSFAPYALFSWIAYGFLAGSPVPIALALAAGPLLGANNYFMHAILFTVVVALARPRWVPLMARGGALSGLLAAPVLFHQFSIYGQSSNLKFDASKHHELPQTLASLARFLTDPQKEIWYCDVDCYWEYGAYVGAAALALGAAGLAWGAWKSRELRPWLITAAVFLAVALGPVSPYAPFSLFLHAPLLNRLEVNTRFLYAFTVCLFLGWAWLLGEALPRALSGLGKGRDAWVKYGVIALAALSLFPSARYAQDMFRVPGRGRELPDLRGRSTDMKALFAPQEWRAERYDALATERGNSVCHVSSSRKYAGELRVGQPALLEGPGAAFFDGRSWRISWDAGATQGQALAWVLNQNYSPQFRARVEGQPGLRPAVEAGPGQLLRVALPAGSGAPGRQEIVISHEAPPGLLAAFGLALLAWSALAARALRDRGRGRGRSRT
jgi:hypothetical protein